MQTINLRGAFYCTVQLDLREKTLGHWETLHGIYKHMHFDRGEFRPRLILTMVELKEKRATRTTLLIFLARGPTPIVAHS